MFSLRRGLPFAVPAAELDVSKNERTVSGLAGGRVGAGVLLLFTGSECRR